MRRIDIALLLTWKIVEQTVKLSVIWDAMTVVWRDSHGTGVVIKTIQASEITFACRIFQDY